MKKKSSDVDFSTISCLPDDVVLEIFQNKVMDLKTLCLCKVVSKRFYAIVHQVDTIRADFNLIDSDGECMEDDWLMKSISMFKKMKSVCIHAIPDYHKTRNSFLGKWKIKLGSNKIDYFVMLLPTSIYDNKGLLLYKEYRNLVKFSIATCCLTDVIWRVHTSWRIMNLDIPLLEKVTITDSENKGTVFVNELTKWKSSSSSFVPRVSECYLPSLELPVSGYVMKEVSLFLVENKDLPDDGTYDRFIDDHEIDFKLDKEEVCVIGGVCMMKLS